jgi:hypothetical protein
MELRENMIANPTRVAMEELQLQDLKNIEAAVEVKQKAHPAKHDVAIVPNDPASGNESKSPIEKQKLEGKGIAAYTVVVAMW